MYGYAADEIVGTNAVRFVPPGRPNDIPELLGRVAAGETVHDYETIHYTRDARLVRVVLSLSPIRDTAGSVTGAATIAREIGEVQDYEATLHAAEERFRAILEVAPIALMIVDPRGRIEFANPRAAELFGYDRYELLALDLADLLPDRVWKRRRDIQDASPDVPPDALGRRRDGSEFPVQIGVNTLEVGDRRLVATAIVDLSARRGAEDEVLEIARQQAAIADLGRRALEGLDLQALLDEAVRLAARVLDAELTKVMELEPDRRALLVRAGVGWKPGVVGDALVPVNAHSQAGTAIRANETIVVEDLRTDGRFTATTLLDEHKVVSGLSAVIHGASGPYGVFGVHTTERRTFTPADVNFVRGIANVLGAAIERHRSEEELRTSTHTLQTLVDAAPMGVAVLNVLGRVQVWNAAAQELFGRSTESMVGRDIFSAGVIDDEATQVLRRVLAGETVVDQERYQRRADGSEVGVRVHGAPLREGGGAIEGAVVLLADVTATRRLEEQLLQAQKMESVGRLAGGVAHDFNNLLTGIFGYVSLLADELHDGSETARELLQGVRESAERAAALTAQLLAFSRRQVLQTRVVEVNDVVRGIEPLLRRIIGETIRLVSVPRSGIGQIQADPTQLEQVVVNLVVNARDAMPDGGTVVIETDEVNFDEAYAQEHFDVSAGRYIMLAVTDEGVGMDADTRMHLFEPFFTTKGPGKGTGLGLATTYGIVKQSGGHIWLYSEPGRGSTFKLYFPRIGQPAEPTRKRRALHRADQGHETVLLVEDEASVREITNTVLTRHGYHVLVAADGQAALRMAESDPRRIDLLITDVVMSGLGGRELAEQIQRRRPGLRTLFISGYTEDTVTRQGVLEANVAFLAKPFSPETLARAVREVLKSPVRPGVET